MLFASSSKGNFIFLFVLALFIQFLSFKVNAQTCNESSRTFSYSGVTCVNFGINFSTSVSSSIDSIVWVWGDGTRTSSFPVAANVQKNYKSSGYYDVKMIRYFKSPFCKDSIIRTISVYDIPSVAATRQSPSPKCAPVTEILELTIDDPVSPATQLTIDFGDGTSQTITYNQLASNVSHQYNKSSCGKNFKTSTNITICENCFVILITATNECGPSLSIASPVAVTVYDKPSPDFIVAKDINPSVIIDTVTNQASTCVVGDVFFENNTESGQGTNCLQQDTVNFLLYDASNNLVDQKSYNCNDAKCDSIFALNFPGIGTYRVVLSQSNSCGAAVSEQVLLIRDAPGVGFSFIPAGCYPSEIVFTNTSGPDIIKSTWDFTGDSTQIAVDTLRADQQFVYTSEGTYTVRLTGFDGFCENTVDTSFSLNILCQDLYVPNAFLPESTDKLFNTFRPVAQNLLKYKMEVFNLWGELLWTSAEIENGRPTEGWDGTYLGQNCPAGTYIWNVEAVLDDGLGLGGRKWEGQKINTRKRSTSGTFSLIR